MEQDSNKSMYDHGREFYEGKIAQATEMLESAETPYERILAMESFEEAQLKLLQTERRDLILNQGVEESGLDFIIMRGRTSENESH